MRIAKAHGGERGIVMKSSGAFIFLASLLAAAIAHADPQPIAHTHTGNHSLMNPDLPVYNLEISWVEPPEGTMIECAAVPEVPDVENLAAIAAMLSQDPAMESMALTFYQAMSNLAHYRIHAVNCLQGL